MDGIGSVVAQSSTQSKPSSVQFLHLSRPSFARRRPIVWDRRIPGRSIRLAALASLLAVFVFSQSAAVTADRAETMVFASELEYCVAETNHIRASIGHPALIRSVELEPTPPPRRRTTRGPGRPSLLPEDPGGGVAFAENQIPGMAPAALRQRPRDHSQRPGDDVGGGGRRRALRQPRRALHAGRLWRVRADRSGDGGPGFPLTRPRGSPNGHRRARPARRFERTQKCASDLRRFAV